MPRVTPSERLTAVAHLREAEVVAISSTRALLLAGRFVGVSVGLRRSAGR